MNENYRSAQIFLI